MKRTFSEIFYQVHEAEQKILSANQIYPVNKFGCPENISNIIARELDINPKVVSRCLIYSRYIRSQTIELLYDKNVSEKFFREIAYSRIILTKNMMMLGKTSIEIEVVISNYIECNFLIFNQHLLGKREVSSSDIVWKEAANG